ncbi:MAG: hypothetical protein LC790_10725, partial [Actinobacteria bacterium]|nr:hypothetical protein [Actinomycetota bacterium]
YLEQGGLGHGYALTVHKSQGMSVERTFVLGSEDLFRELGYTALSRHRDSCRFYINAGQPQDRQRLGGLEAEPDPLDQVRRALGESRAKELALERHERDEELLAAPTEELATSSAQLDELLSSYPYLARREAKLAEKEEVAATLARDAAKRLAATRREREALGPLARRERARLDLQIERQSAAQSRCEAELARARDDRLAADAAGEQWLEQNGAALAELCASERELIRRREADYDRAIQEARIDPPDHLREHLGERPEGLAGREAWDEAAAALLHYEQRFGELPGPDEPTRSGQARAWRFLQSALRPPDQHMSLHLRAERTAELDRGGDFDLGP